MTEIDEILLHCLHNALWMTEHESEIQAIDEHIAVLDPGQKAIAKEMVRELAQR